VCVCVSVYIYIYIYIYILTCEASSTARGPEGGSGPAGPAVDPGLQHAPAEEHRDPEPEEGAAGGERPSEKQYIDIYIYIYIIYIKHNTYM